MATIFTMLRLTPLLYTKKTISIGKKMGHYDVRCDIVQQQVMKIYVA